MIVLWRPWECHRCAGRAGQGVFCAVYDEAPLRRHHGRRLLAPEGMTEGYDGHRQVEQAAPFYEFSLEKHISPNICDYRNVGIIEGYEGYHGA